MKIKHRLILTHGILVILSIIIVFINLVAYQGMSQDATIINYAGKLRAISYNMSQIASRIDRSDNYTELAYHREELESRMKEFEDIISGLSKIERFAISHQGTVTSLEIITNEWNETFKPKYESILDNNGGTELDLLDDKIDLFVKSINDMVTNYTLYSAGKVERSLTINRILIVAIILVTIYSFASTRKRIGVPINILMNEMKGLTLIDDEVSESLKNLDSDEIAEMGHYFNVMLFDQLTKALNRRTGLSKLKQLVQYDNVKFNTISLCMIDVDGLKEVNDQLGHNIGDELLITVVNSIKEGIREEDFIVRMGGDEFLLVINGVGKEVAETVWQRINDKFQRINENESRPYLIGVSHGIVEYNNSEHVALDELLKTADEKMYTEKKLLKSKVIK